MAGKQKFAERTGKHLHEPIEAACPITRPGGTTAQIIGAVGGLAGAAISSAAKNKASDVQVGQFGWLGIGSDHFALTNSSFNAPNVGVIELLRQRCTGA